MGDLFDSGNAKIKYELLDVNTDFIITPPDDALNTPSLDFGIGGDDGDSETDSSEFPLLDDAEEILSVAGITSYYTYADMATVVDFYRLELALEAWIEDTADVHIGETEGFLKFDKDETSLIITLNLQDDGRVKVDLVTTGEWNLL